MNTPYAIYSPARDRFLSVTSWKAGEDYAESGCTWNEGGRIYFAWSDMINVVNSFQILFGKELARELMDCILVPVVLDENRRIIECMHDQNIAVRDWI
jgi:hypothetical protein